MDETIGYYLRKLPRGYKERAIRNTVTPSRLDLSAGDMPHALSRSFSWSISPEDFEFWDKVKSSYNYGAPLPDLPNNTVCKK